MFGATRLRGGWGLWPVLGAAEQRGNAVPAGHGTSQCLSLVQVTANVVLMVWGEEVVPLKCSALTFAAK